MHVEQGYTLSVSEQTGGSDRPGVDPALGTEVVLQRSNPSAIWGSQRMCLVVVVVGGLVTYVMSNSCDPMDRGAWQATVHGILQARTLEWVGGSSRPRSRTWVSCIVGGFFTN